MSWLHSISRSVHRGVHSSRFLFDGRSDSSDIRSRLRAVTLLGIRELAVLLDPVGHHFKTARGLGAEGSELSKGIIGIDFSHSQLLQSLYVFTDSL